MAQNNQDIQRAINELFKDYKNSLEKAVKYATRKAMEDIYGQSMTCLEEYYDAYDPTSYNRTDSLWRCIVPYSHIDHKHDHIVSMVGVEYDASVLEGTYSGSKKYSPTDSSWIIENYLNGVHPATDGSRIAGEAFYYENIDVKSPTQKMEVYLNEYIEDFYYNTLIGFAKEVL